MQQLCITLMAVFGMIVPVMDRKLERLLQAPRMLKLSQRLLLAIAAASRPAAVAGAASQATEQPGRPGFMATLSPAARRVTQTLATAAFWRGADVDKPNGWRRPSHREQAGARLAGLLCILDRRPRCNY